MSFVKTIGSGMAGSLALTLINETARRVLPNAPRLDILGQRAVGKTMQAVGQQPPTGSRSYPLALVSDLVSNSLYYSVAASGRNRNVWMKGALMGLSAGIGAVILPQPMGLGEQPTARTWQTKAMTVAWYVAGGLATAAVARLLSRRSRS